MRWLIVLDGSDRCKKAASFAAGLMRPGEDEALLLAVPSERGAGGTESALAEARSLFAAFSPEERIQSDDLTETVERMAELEGIELVVYGSRGRSGWRRLIFGSVAAELEHSLACSLLVVRGEPQPIRKILVATALNPDSMHAVELGGEIALRTKASVTLLHVMSQLALGDAASEMPLQATAEEAIVLHTREGDALAARLDYLRARGLQADAHLRHGLVLDEVVAEMAEGSYDLLVVGGHRLPADLPFANLLAADMADEILMHTRSPVLIA